jgi:hypothetical protein
MADSETPSTSALSMDRGISLGNSLGPDSRRRLHVKVSNSTSEAIPVFLTNESVPANQINNYYEINALSSGVETNIFSYTIPPVTAFILQAIDFSGDNKAIYRLYIDGSVMEIKRTSFTQYNDAFTFDNLNLNTGQIIKVTVLHSRPYVADFNSTVKGYFT